MSEDIDIDRDNIITIQLLKDDIAQSLISVTKITAKIVTSTQDIEVSCETSTEWPIKWSGLSTTGEVQLKLGPELPSLSSKGAKLWVIVYDPSNINGIVWDSMHVHILTI